MPSLRSTRMLEAAALVGQTDDRRRESLPQVRVGEQRRAVPRDLVDVRTLGGALGVEPPHRGEGGIGELHPPVGAEHRDAFLQRVERLALHAGQRVDLRGERVALRGVVEEISDAALRVGARRRRATRARPADARSSRPARSPDRRRAPASSRSENRPVRAIGASRADGRAFRRRSGCGSRNAGVERPDLAIGGVVEGRAAWRDRRSPPRSTAGRACANRRRSARSISARSASSSERSPATPGGARLGRDLDRLEQLAPAGDDGGRAPRARRRDLPRASAASAQSRGRTVRARAPPRRRRRSLRRRARKRDWPSRCARRASRVQAGSRRRVEQRAQRRQRAVGRGVAFAQAGKLQALAGDVANAHDRAAGDRAAVDLEMAALEARGGEREGFAALEQPLDRLLHRRGEVRLEP